MAKQIIARHNICAAKEYTTSQGEVKTQWVDVGTAVMFEDGSFLVNINALPTGNWWDGTLQGFKQEPREQQGGYRQSAPPPAAGYRQTTYGQPSQGYQQPSPAVPSASAPFPAYEESPF